MNILENVNLDIIGSGLTTNNDLKRRPLQLNVETVVNFTSTKGFGYNPVNADTYHRINDNSGNYSLACTNLSKDGDCVPTVGGNHKCIGATVGRFVGRI